MKRLHFFLLILASIFLTRVAMAQPGWTYYKNAELPVGGISFCIQAESNSDGVYVGLTGGLEKFNGTDWKGLYYNELNPSSIKNEYNIRSLKISGEDLWAGTNEGLIRFKGAERQRYYSKNIPSFGDDKIRGFAIDKDGDVWFFNFLLGISKLDLEADTVIRYSIPPTIPFPIESDAALYIDSSKRLWYSIKGKFISFNNGAVSIVDSLAIPSLKAGESVSTITMLTDSSILVVMKRHIGIYRYNDGNPTYEEIPYPDGLLDDNEFFANAKIDKDMNIWVLSRVDIGDKILSRHFYKLNTSNEWSKYEIPFIEGTTMQSYSFSDFTIDRNGKVWFAAPSYGVFVFDPAFVSIEDEILKGFKLYPNPTDGELLVDTLEGFENFYFIVDLYGRTVLTGNLTKNRVNVSSLTTGTYFLRIGNSTKPFIKS